MENMFSNAKVIFFDTSDTLYINQDLESEYLKKLVELIAKTHNITTKEASSQLAQAVERLKPVKKHVTKVSVASEFGITRSQVHQEAFGKVVPSRYLHNDKDLDDAMLKLSRHYRLGIISNLRKSHMLEIFLALGLSSKRFTYYVTEDIVKEIKPSHEPFVKAVDLSGCEANQCIYVGNSPTKDMLPAHEVGMKTILICEQPATSLPDYVDATVSNVKRIADLLHIS